MKSVNKRDIVMKILLIIIVAFIPYAKLLGDTVSVYFKLVPDVLVAFMFIMSAVEKRIRLNTIDIFFGIFLGFSLISTLIKNTPTAFVVETRSIAVFYILYIAIRDIEFTQPFFRWLSRVLGVNMLILIGFSILEKFTYKLVLFPQIWRLSMYNSSNYSRVYSLLGNPNTFGAYAILTLIILFFIAEDSKKESWWIFFVSIFSIMLSASRSSLLALVLVLLFILYNSKKWRAKLAIIMSISIITSILLVNAISFIEIRTRDNNNFYKVSYEEMTNYKKTHNIQTDNEQEYATYNSTLTGRFKKIFNSSTINKSMETGRLFSVVRGMEIFLENPIIGTGFGTYGDAASLILGSPIYSKYGIRENFYSDNEYIKVLVETGVLGFIAFLLFISSMIFIIIKRRNTLLAILIIIFLFLGMFYNIWEIKPLAFFYWLCMGIGERFKQNSGKTVESLA